jgi:hypothetical protein
MKILGGWEPAFMLPCARFIRCLTQRLGFVCEPTSPVYVPAAWVSRFFCFEGIGPKPLPVKIFANITGVKPA